MRPALQLLLQGFSVIINVVISQGSDIGYFWQLNDLHLDLNYSQNPQCHGRFGNYQCDSPLDLVVSAINATQLLLEKDQRPDFVIWTGDNGPHARFGNTYTIMVDSLRNVSHHMRRVYPPTANQQNRIYVLPVLGNHDVFPFDRMSPDPTDPARLSWCHRLATDPLLWEPWISSSSNQWTSTKTDTAPQQPPPSANYSTGCFFSHLLPEFRLILVALNGLIWYENNPLSNESIPDPLGQFRWLDRTLSWARDNRFKVLLVSHFPPGASENTPKSYRFLKPSFNQQLVQLLVRYADQIMAGLFAHTHVDSFRVVSDRNDLPVLPLFTSPSVTPMRLRSLGSFNPRIRLYRYNRSLGGTLLGYTQYIFNLSVSQPTWTLEYDTQQEYGLPDLSATSLSSLLNEFAVDNRADGPWSLYWAHELGGRPHEPVPDLTPDGLCPEARSRCRCGHLCPMRHVDLERMDACLSNCPALSAMLIQADGTTASTNETTGASVSSATNESTDQSSSLPIIVGVIVTFLFILIGVVLIVNRETCRHRRLRGRRPLIGTVRDGNVAFSAPNGDLAPFHNGLGSPVELDQFSEGGVGGGSSTAELRIAFHPKYVTDDDDDVPHQLGSMLRAPRDRSHAVLYVPPGQGGRLTTTYGQQHQLTGESDASPTGMLSPHSRLNGNLRLMSSSGYAVPPIMVNNNPKTVIANGGRRAAGGGGGSSDLLYPNAPTSMPCCPTEDYYADDEDAFGDDEDGLVDDRLMLADCDSSLSTSEIESPWDPNHSFSLDQGHVPLTQPKPGYGPRRLSKRLTAQLKSSVQSIKDPSALLTLTGGRQSAPALRHSQSATMRNATDVVGATDDSPVVVAFPPSSYSAAIRSSPYHGIPYSLTNGHTDEDLANSHPGRLPNLATGAADPTGGYAYMRI